MRIAVIDLLFSWPPHGGADVDVYHITRELRALKHDARVFFARETDGWERGQADPESLPFPAERLDFPAGTLDSASAASRFLEALRPFDPEVVLLTQGYFLKVPIIHALSDYPIISRCYAHEVACHRDILRFRRGVPCSHAYNETPDVCRSCALASLGPEIRGESPTAWTREYLASEAWSARFHGRFAAAMKMLRAVIITTEHMREQVRGLCTNIHVIPHGVDGTRFRPPEKATTAPYKPVLFVPGRLEDPAKGVSVLMDAAALLAAEGLDFEVRATLPEGHPGPSWLKPLGKLDFEDMPAAYRAADICVVPSLWEEPFGIVALEAMATGIPVCASRTGGLQDIVTPETGLVFERGNAPQLADCLRRLLTDPGLRHTMGEAGRRRALEHYSWEHITRKHYDPLLASL